MSTQTVTNWLGRKHEPKLTQLRRIAAALNVSIGYLAGEGGDIELAPSEAERVIIRIGDLKMGASVGSFRDSAPALFDLLSEAELLARQSRKSPKHE